MKLNETYVIREFNDTVYAVPLDVQDENRKEPIILNGTARLLWEALAEEKTEEELIEVLLSEYDIDRETAAKDTAAFLSSIRKAGLISD